MPFVLTALATFTRFIYVHINKSRIEYKQLKSIVMLMILLEVHYGLTIFEKQLVDQVNLVTSTN